MSIREFKTVRRRAAFVFAWPALLLVLLAPVSAGAAKQDAPGSVKGTITELGGEALAGVEVTLSSEGEVRASATTDKKGAFSMKLEPGDYLLVFEREGYARFESPVRVEPGSRQVVSAELLDEAAGRRSEAAAAYNAAAAAYRVGDQAAAKKGFRAAVEADSTLVEAHRVLAGIYLDEGVWAQAAASAEAFLAERPNDRDALGIAYEAYRQSGDREQALRARSILGKDPKLAPKLAVHALNEGVAAGQTGDEERAKTGFEEALELDPSLAAAHFALATAEYRGKRFDEAMGYLTTGLELEPDHVQGRRLGFLIEDARNSPEAAAAAMKAYAEVDAEGAIEILFERAEVDFRNGDRASARSGLITIVGIDEGHAEAQHLLGLAYLPGDRELAKQHLRRFLELAPEHAEAETVRQMLAEL